MITHRNSDNHHQLRGRLKVVPTDAAGAVVGSTINDDGPRQQQQLEEEIEIHLASSSSFSLLSASSSWGLSSPRQSPGAGAPSSPTHYLGIWTSTTPRPTDEEFHEDDDENDGDDDSDSDDNHVNHLYVGDNEGGGAAAASASISDEVMRSRTGSRSFEVGGPDGTSDVRDKYNDNDTDDKIGDAWDHQLLFQSASSCCVGGEGEDEEGDSGDQGQHVTKDDDKKDYVVAADDEERRDAVHDILQTASSSLLLFASTAAEVASEAVAMGGAVAASSSSMGIECLPVSVTADDARCNPSSALDKSASFFSSTSRPTTPSHPVSAPPSTPLPPTPAPREAGPDDAVDPTRDDVDDSTSTGSDNTNDSPISRYRKEAEARHRQETADLQDSGRNELLSARIAAAAANATTTTLTPVPSSIYGLPPNPHNLLLLPPSVRVPTHLTSLTTNSASATPINNMSPLSLDSSSANNLRFLAAGMMLPLSQPATPVPQLPDVLGDKRRTRQHHHQELLYYDDMMLLPPTPHGDDDDDRNGNDMDPDDDDHGDGDIAGASAAAESNVHSGLSHRASQPLLPPPPPPPPPPPLEARSGHGGGRGRRLQLRRNADRRPVEEDPGVEERRRHERHQQQHRPDLPEPPPDSSKRHDDVGPSLVDDDEEDDEIDDETATDANDNDNEVESATNHRHDAGQDPSDRRTEDGESSNEGMNQRGPTSTDLRDPSSGSTAGTDPSRSKNWQHEQRTQPMPPDWEEKKEALELPTLRETSDDQDDNPDRLRANSPPVQYRFASEADLPPLSNRRPKFPTTRSASTGDISTLDFEKTLSMTESDVGSLDGLPPSLKSRWGNDFNRSEREALQRIDGVSTVVAKRSLRRASTPDATSAMLRPIKVDSAKQGATVKTASHLPPASQKPPLPSLKSAESFSFFSNWPMKLLWGENEDNDASKEQNQQALGLSSAACCRQEEEEDGMRSRFRWRSEDDSLALLACANLIHHRPAPAAPSTLIRVSNDAPLLSFCQTYNPSSENRMPAWVEHQFRTRDKSTKDGQFLLGTSRAVIVHEIVRGNWTWATAWSPDGSHLAVATENHHLAVLDTRYSTVWRVRHDKKLQGPVKQGTTHSIRSIAWGKDFIAIGGTGNAVSIISPIEPYTVLQTIPNCGFVGSLDWRPNSNDLVIGSRLDRAMIVRVRTTTSTPTPGPCSGTIDAINSLFPQVSVLCETRYTVERKHWVNAVAYSHTGRYLAIGDAGGIVLVYDLHEADMLKHDAPMDESKELVGLLKSFTLDDSVLAVEWSADGCWLYAGGEDFAVSVIDTEHWEIVHKIKRDRWVQCIAASRSGTHVAVGGVSSEVSLLETKNGWDSVMGMELNGLVPLSAKWHPRDQFLSLTGQNNSILVVETTNARHVRGHHLHSVGGILAVEFSPDGRMAAVGNESGVVTFYSLSGSSFVTSYELVVMVENDRLSIQWSRNGLFVVIATRDSLLIVGRKRRDRYGKAVPPKCSGFSIRKVVKDVNGCNAVSIDLQSQYVAVAGSKGTSILDVSRDFATIREWPSGPCYAAAWSPLGRWLATIGKDKVLTIFDTGEERVDRWRPVFSVTCEYVGRALAWGPLIVGGLLYLAYAGDGNEINVMEIRTQEGTWETILRIQRPGAIHALDWHMDGLLAAALSNGTVSIVDLAYLQSGVAVNEMDYNWQRQALTSFTEIRRNRGSNQMRAVKWIPSAPGSDCLLAIGGSDGELEIVDLTERQRCRGYAVPVTN